MVFTHPTKKNRKFPLDNKKLGGINDMSAFTNHGIRFGVSFMEPQTAKPVSETQDEFSSQLAKVVKDFTSEINYCQEQANLWLERKKTQQTKMAEALQQVQKQCGIEPQKPMPVPVVGKKDATVSQLIRTFLESNGPARPRDIRRFLLNQGRTTNPGVALGRLVAEGVLKNTERGVYSVS